MISLRWSLLATLLLHVRGDGESDELQTTSTTDGELTTTVSDHSVPESTSCSIASSVSVENIKYREVTLDHDAGQGGNCFTISSNGGTQCTTLRFQSTGRCESGCAGCYKASKIALVDPDGTETFQSDCLFEHSGSDCDFTTYSVSFGIDTRKVGTWYVSSLSRWAGCSDTLGNYGNIAEIRVVCNNDDLCQGDGSDDDICHSLVATWVAASSWTASAASALTLAMLWMLHLLEH
mmetsp:Transcript_11524/g.20405  ORF Transcript_11524/g.20405 Transcript_11524/m.20405 type:complete len:235 (+) Transcript_11524:42-746(+)